MSLASDTYTTIEQPSEGIFRDKGSRFIAYAFPIQEEEEWKNILEQVKSQHPKARHHCWAYRLGPEEEVFRVNDDGEPSGTAGRPIYNTLKSYEITDVMVVVVRYFGGTLLGVPGLINAYKTATVECLEQATIVERIISSRFQIRYDYPQMNDVMQLIKQNDWDIVYQDFALDCELRVEVRKKEEDKFISLLEQIHPVKYKKM